MNLLDGKTALLFGVANDRSIAWGIAKKLSEAGCRVGFTYAFDALEKRVRPLAESLGSDFVEPCDVNDDAQIERTFAKWKEQYGSLDILVHSIAYAEKDDLKGAFYSTSRKGFNTAMEVSVYSLISLTRAAVPLMEGRQGSIITLSYYGAEKVIKGYNVMGVAKAALESSVRYLSADLGHLGVRVNAISAGPIKTLAASGIGEFRTMLKHHEASAPLRRNITQDEVGKAALYLCSDLASGVTGEVHYVDAGYNVVSPPPSGSSGE